MMSHCSVFHSAENSLGEGLFVDVDGQRLFWVDIDGGQIYQKNFDGREFRSHEVGGQPSALLSLRDGLLEFCNDEGISELDIESGETRLLANTPDSITDPGFRSNDGVALASGVRLYGTMECVPTGINGDLCLFDGETNQALGTKIGIPNGFVPLGNADILIADSFTGCVNLYEVDVENRAVRLQRLWHDFRPLDGVPDGGCADGRGNVYFALWDGAGIAVLDYSGRLKNILSLPVLRPTNCKLADDRTLFVTSARKDMTDTQLDKYPLSGSVLALDLTEIGNGYAG